MITLQKVFIAIGILVILIVGYLYMHQDTTIDPVIQEKEIMSLSVYIQDKEMAATTDCTITKKVMYQIPKTTAVADASLQLLFKDELSRYGVYSSVSIVNGVAKVMLASNKTPQGGFIGGLSSCEGGHLMSVLTDTLTQYNTITSVELYSPEGKIEF